MDNPVCVYPAWNGMAGGGAVLPDSFAVCLMEVHS